MVSRNHNITEKLTCGFTSSLSSAASEWFLIILLYLNGLLSYLITRFANYYKLQTPCLLCSRLDHILGSEKPGFYKKLLCKSHKLEMSSLFYCYNHHKLADVHDMCEACMLSFATENATSSTFHRSLLAKLEINPGIPETNHQKSPETTKNYRSQSKPEEKDAVRVPLLSDLTLGFTRTGHCSCCNAPFRMKSHAHRLLQTEFIVLDAAEPTGAVLGLNGQMVHQSQDALNRRKDIDWKNNVSPKGNHVFGHLSHIHTELKITSDTESEIPASDDDGRKSLPQASSDAKNKLPQNLMPNVAIATIVMSKPLPGEPQEEKIIHTARTVTDAIQDKQVSSIEPSSAACALETGPTNTVKKLNWSEAQEPPHTKPGIESHLDPAEATDAMKIADVQCSSSANKEIPKVVGPAETSSKPVQTNNDHVSSIPSILDLNDAYKLVLSGKVYNPSPSPSPSPRGYVRANEDSRLLLSQISATQGLELPWNDITSSPRVSGTGDDFKFLDRSSSSGLQKLMKKISMERNESGFDSSLDGSIFSEIEGENSIERLKKQVELERKTLLLLYKELEEERNASAIAVNQAMAMITRLQEEKAAMQTEASQYQRMMEEQAEYDQEVLEKATDLLAQRERELHDLEAEIIAYRRRFLDEYKDK